MTTTYKPLTPGEALDALIRRENVEYRYNLDAADVWTQACWGHQFKAPLECRYQYRLVVEPKPETAESVISNSLCDKEFFRALVAALKHEIKSELREEMKK